MHLFHFMQNNLSFSDVTQSRFWIKLVVYMYLITASLLLCPLHPRSQSGCCYVKVQRLLSHINFKKKKMGDCFKLCGLLTISKLHLITASLYSFAGELPDPNQDAIMSRCNVCSPTFLKLLSKFQKKLRDCVAFSQYLNFIWSQRPCILLQVNFQIPIRMLLWQGAAFVLRKPMSIIVHTVTKRFVMTARRHIVIYWNVKYPESTIKSKEDGID